MIENAPGAASTSSPAAGSGKASLLTRIIRQLTFMGFRGVSSVAKFILTLYTARFLGLADLGVYGLVAAAGTLSPALLGFGLTEYVSRRIVLMSQADALRAMTARLAISTGTHVIFQPLIWAANIALGSPVPSEWAWLIAPIIWLEHLSSDVHDMLTSRGQIVLTSILQFIRAALWPLVVVGLGLIFPGMRTLETILEAWVIGLLATWVVVIGWLLQQRSGALLDWRDITEQLGHLRASFLLYLRNITATASLFIDRYLISLTLGLEATGVYVFFWSVANVVQGMIISVVLQPQNLHLIGAVARDDMDYFRAFQRKLQKEAAAWTVMLSLGAFIAVVILLPFLQRPALEHHLPLFALIVIATWARIAADKYAFVLIALHRDRSVLIASASGALASAVFNVTLLPFLGLWGAAVAFLLTGLVVLGLEMNMSRHPAAIEKR